MLEYSSSYSSIYVRELTSINLPDLDVSIQLKTKLIIDILSNILVLWHYAKSILGFSVKQCLTYKRDLLSHNNRNTGSSVWFYSENGTKSIYCFESNIAYNFNF